MRLTLKICMFVFLKELWKWPQMFILHMHKFNIRESVFCHDWCRHELVLCTLFLNYVKERIRNSKSFVMNKWEYFVYVYLEHVKWSEAFQCFVLIWCVIWKSWHEVLILYMCVTGFSMKSVLFLLRSSHGYNGGL